MRLHHETMKLGQVHEYVQPIRGQSVQILNRLAADVALSDAHKSRNGITASVILRARLSAGS